MGAWATWCAANLRASCTEGTFDPMTSTGMRPAGDGERKAAKEDGEAEAASRKHLGVPGSSDPSFW
jgi:hypothetical protein